MGLVGGNRPHPRALIFDLDRCLIDPRPAWRYCVEEAIAATNGRRVSAQELVDEYHQRPWHHALRVLLDSPDAVRGCAELSQTMFERSGMKKLLVHEGVGMALDALRGEGIELGAISRLPHQLALKQVQSTGLDRFLAVLAATPAESSWEPVARFEHCIAFLESPLERSAFVSGEEADLRAMRTAGVVTFRAGWAPGEDAANSELLGDLIERPGDSVAVVLRYWSSHFRGRA